MSTITGVTKETATKSRNLVDMNWDPITRIVGSLGIFTKIDFDNRQVAECHSTSSIFRGYSIFMKGKDPRDAHFITSRICGICGDNHATCATYAQNMAFGIRPPAIAEWIVNLGEAAEYMFDHNIFQDNLVGVDFCEQMVKETNPSVLAKAEKTASPHANLHGYRTIADIMRALNPFTGEFYREALQVSRMTREMFCLMEGRHVHPSTLYPGGVGTVPTIQLFTDYLVRLMKYVEFMKKVVPLHDDLFDFFYEALPGYEKVGQRRVLLACWGSFNNPDVCDYTYKNMTTWGRGMFVTPGVVVDGKLVTNDLVDINLNIRILLGSSYYDDWKNSETFVKTDPLGNPVDHFVFRPRSLSLFQEGLCGNDITTLDGLKGTDCRVDRVTILVARELRQSGNFLFDLLVHSVESLFGTREECRPTHPLFALIRDRRFDTFGFPSFGRCQICANMGRRLRQIKTQAKHIQPVPLQFFFFKPSELWKYTNSDVNCVDVRARSWEVGSQILKCV